MTSTAGQELPSQEFDRLFLEARSQNGYLPTPVADSVLERLYAIVRMGPTSMNCSPARFAFVRSAAERQRLLACVAPANVAKIEQAPVTVIIGMDLGFVDTLPKLFPHRDVTPMFRDNDALVHATAFRNSSLQGGYLIVAARALGLDCGPMSGFDAARVDAAFWAGTRVRTNFICTLGHGDPAKVFPRLPRLAFDEACRML
jgi:3-hydroxypropanoate dehydrogenase